MTSFDEKDIEGLVQCPKCKMWSNLGYCWNCNNRFGDQGEEEDEKCG